MLMRRENLAQRWDTLACHVGSIPPQPQARPGARRPPRGRSSTHHGGHRELLREGSTYADLSIETIAARGRHLAHDVLRLLRRTSASCCWRSRATCSATSSPRPTSGAPATTTTGPSAELRAHHPLAASASTRHPVAMRVIVEATFYDEEVRTAWRARASERHIERADPPARGRARRAAASRRTARRSRRAPARCTGAIHAVALQRGRAAAGRSARTSSSTRSSTSTSSASAASCLARVAPTWHAPAP